MMPIFAILTACGVKRFECRGWHNVYRGPLLIHAGSKRDPLRFEDFEEWKEDLAKVGYTRYDQLPHSAIVGIADLVDIRPAESVKLTARDKRAVGAYQNRNLFVLKNPMLLPAPVPSNGWLNFWRPGSAVTEAVIAQLKPLL